MKKTEIITYLSLILIVTSLTLSFVVSDVIASKLLASLGIIIGSVTSYYLSNDNNLTVK